MSATVPASQRGAIAAFVVATAPDGDDATRELLWRDVAGHSAVYWTLDALASLDGLGFCAIETPLHLLHAAQRIKDDRLPQVDGAVMPTKNYTWRHALAMLEDTPALIEWIIILDAAFPLVTPACLRAGLRAAEKTGVAIAGEPVKETLKRTRGQIVVETPSRDGLRRLVSPVIFQRATLRNVLNSYGPPSTVADDLFALAQLAGAPLTVFDAGYPGLRATHADDWPIIETLLKQRQTEIENA